MGHSLFPPARVGRQGIGRPRAGRRILGQARPAGGHSGPLVPPTTRCPRAMHAYPSATALDCHIFQSLCRSLSTTTVRAGGRISLA